MIWRKTTNRKRFVFARSTSRCALRTEKPTIMCVDWPKLAIDNATGWLHWLAVLVDKVNQLRPSNIKLTITHFEWHHFITRKYPKFWLHRRIYAIRPESIWCSTVKPPDTRFRASNGDSWQFEIIPPQMTRTIAPKLSTKKKRWAVWDHFRRTIRTLQYNHEVAQVHMQSPVGCRFFELNLQTVDDTFVLLPTRREKSKRMELFGSVMGSLPNHLTPNLCVFEFECFLKIQLKKLF